MTIRGAGARPRLQVYTLLFRADAPKGLFNVSYEVIAETAAEAGRFAVADFQARGERALDIERVDVFPLANPLAAKGVTMRVGCRYFAD